MKIVKIIVGVLAGVYALAQCVQFVAMLSRGAHGSAVLGSVTGVCIGAAVAIALFGSAFRKKEE